MGIHGATQLPSGGEGSDPSSTCGSCSLSAFPISPFSAAVKFKWSQAFEPQSMCWFLFLFFCFFKGTFHVYSLDMFVPLFTHTGYLTIWGCCLSLTCSRWQGRSDGDGHFPGRSGHTVRDGFCAAVTRHYHTAHTAPRTHTPQAHEDDHIWYTDDILSLLWQHELIFMLWHPLLCGCYSSQIYHFNGEVVRPEDYLRDKYIIACSFRYRPDVIVPWVTLSRRMPSGAVKHT